MSSAVYSLGSESFSAALLRGGMSLAPNSTRKMMPIRAHGTPTGLIEKRLRWRFKVCWARPETMRLVLVPRRVSMPPRMAAKERGKRSWEGEMRFLLPHSETGPTSTATRGVLFMKPLRSEVAGSSLPKAPLAVFGCPKKNSTSRSTAPVSRTPAATT